MREKILNVFYQNLIESAGRTRYNRHAAGKRGMAGTRPHRWAAQEKKGVSGMIPCGQTCSSYCEGCHKTCARWAEFQQQKSRERQAKKDYLSYYNELCSSVARQFRSIGAVYLSR